MKLRMLLSLMTAISSTARAADDSPVRLVAPCPAGGPADVIARVISEPLGEALKRAVVIDNRAGASGTIGAGFVARFSPDGSTLLFNTFIQVILPHLKQLSYDTLKDFTPLAQINTIPFVLVVNKDLPFKTVADLVAYAKAKSGKLNFASNSAGSSSHIAAEQFKRIAGVDLVHVAYKGSAPALTDLVGGRVQLMFEQGPSVLPFLQSGQLRALAVTSAMRSEITPDVPTFGEAGYPSFVYSNWQGIWGPANMSPAAKRTLTSALESASRRSDVRKRLRDFGTEPSTLTGDNFAVFANQEYQKVGQIVDAAKITLDQ